MAISVENHHFFPPPVYIAPLKGSLWNWVTAQGSEENRMMGLPDSQKSFKMIQYRRWTDTTPSDVAVAYTALTMSCG